MCNIGKFIGGQGAGIGLTDFTEGRKKGTVTEEPPLTKRTRKGVCARW